MDDAVTRLYDLTALTRPESEEEMAAQVEARVLELVGTSEESPARFPLYEFSPPDLEVLGRTKELAEIDQALDPSMHDDRRRSIGIYGMEGMGKTALARAYALDCRQRSIYDAIFWMRGETRADLRDSMGEVASALELPQASRSADSDQNVLLVKRWLARTKKRALFIFDDVDDSDLLKTYIAAPVRCQYNILITTRYKHVAVKSPGGGRSIELEPVDEQEGVLIFENARVHQDRGAKLELERAQTVEMLRQFGGLPLALVHIGSYMGYREFTIQEFQEKYTRMAQTIHQDSEAHQDRHSLATVWEMHFELIQRKDVHADTGKLLGILALLSPDQIPVDLFLPKDSLIGCGYADFIDNEAKLDSCIDLLVRVALIKRSGSSISLHRLVQQAFMHSRHGLLAEERQRVFAATTSLINHRFPKMGGIVSLYSRWAECSTWYHHAYATAQALRQLSGSSNPLVATEDFNELLKNASWYQYEIGELGECLDLLQIGYEACLDKNSLVFAYYHNTAYCVYYERNDMKRSRESLNTCLAIRRKKLGQDHPDWGNYHSNECKLLMSEFKLDEALQHCHKAIENRRRTCDARSVYLAVAYMELGRIHFVRREIEFAKEYYDRSESLFVANGYAEGWLHGSILFAKGNLALHGDDLPTAREKYHHAHRICAALGPTQILGSAVHFKLGVVATRQGDFAEAESQFRDALAIANYRRDNGEIARIQRGKALALLQNPHATDAEQAEAKQLQIQASILRMQVISDMKLELPAEETSEDDAFDNLVCGYFR